MPRQNLKLTDAEIRGAKPREKAYKLYDNEGLILLIRPTGTKVWQYPYKLHGKWNIYTIGKYPDVGASQARKSRDDARDLIKSGIAPVEQKSGYKLSKGDPNSLAAIMNEWLSKQIWVAKHKSNVTRQMSADVLTYIGQKPLRGVTRQDLLNVVQRVEDRDALDVAKRTAQHLVQVFDYALLKGKCDNNPATGLAKIVKARRTENRPYVAEKDLPGFLQKLDDYRGGELVKLGTQLLMLTMVRPGELRGAKKDEFDLEKAEWRIPAARMKMKREHIVPLSKQAIQIIRRLFEITGTNELLLPGADGSKPISDVTLTKCLIILGYGGKATPHGMRSTASTILNERGYNRDWIERQLAHIPKDKVRAAYNHAQYLLERRRMLQDYADLLDELREPLVRRKGKK